MKLHPLPNVELICLFITIDRRPLHFHLGGGRPDDSHYLARPDLIAQTPSQRGQYDRTQTKIERSKMDGLLNVQ